MVEHKSFCAVIHSFHYLLLSTHLFIRFFFIKMTFKVILMIRLPRFWTHIAEVLSASATHKVTSHASLNCLLTLRTDLSICTNPLSICFLSHDLLHPFHFLLTMARIVVIRLTFKAKYFSTGTFHSLDIRFINSDTIVTIISCAKLIISILHYKELTNFFAVSLHKSLFAN